MSTIKQTSQQDTIPRTDTRKLARVAPSSPFTTKPIASADEEPFWTAFLKSFNRPRDIATEFQDRSPRDKRSKANDELSARDQAMLDELVKRAPLNIPEEVSKRAGRIGRVYTRDPNQDARKWLDGIEISLANRQNDSSTRPHWAVLRDAVNKLPAGARVRDLDSKLLDYCLGNLIKNKI